MFRRIYINNFKSLVDFSIDLTGTTVIVGGNGTGKSSVLQAIGFLCAAAREDFDVYLQNRGWRVENIKSKLIDSNELTFESEIDLNDVIYKWKLVLLLNKSKNDIKVASERITINETDIFINEKGKAFLQFPTSDMVAVSNAPVLLQNKASTLRVLDGLQGIDSRIQKLIDFLKCSESFELLSPGDMRLSSRGKTDTIGTSGRELPSFIKYMDEAQKKSFTHKVRELLRGQIKNVGTRAKSRGWMQIEIEEHYKKSNITINSVEMSDGILRLLGFLAISEMKRPEPVMLLDEIENGINADYAEGVIKIFEQVYKEKKHQMIMTTHSNLFEDYVNPDDIVYLYRDDKGRTRAGNPFKDEGFRRELEYMWPGEILLNHTRENIIEKLLSEL